MAKVSVTVKLAVVRLGGARGPAPVRLRAQRAAGHDRRRRRGRRRRRCRPGFRRPRWSRRCRIPTRSTRTRRSPRMSWSSTSCRTRAGNRDIWTSRRATAADPWQAPTRVGELDSADSDWAPAVSLDGLRIWFASDRDSVGRGQIWRATRASRAAAVGSARAGGRAGERQRRLRARRRRDGDDAVPQLRPRQRRRDGRRRRLRHLRGDARRHRRRVGLAGGGARASNSNDDEYDPFVAQGGLVVFFTSMRSGMGDIYWSSRRSLAEPFAPPVPLDDLNSNAYDSDATLSPDLGHHDVLVDTLGQRGDLRDARRCAR